MKEWHEKYSLFYETWWKENKGKIIPLCLENLSPEVKASHSEEELMMYIKEMYREYVIDYCFWLENYRETHKGDLDKRFKECIPIVGEMLLKEL